MQLADGCLTQRLFWQIVAQVGRLARPSCLTSRIEHTGKQGWPSGTTLDRAAKMRRSL